MYIFIIILVPNIFCSFWVTWRSCGSRTNPSLYFINAGIMDDASFFISLNLVPSKKNCSCYCLVLLSPSCSPLTFVQSSICSFYFFYTSPLTHIISSSSSSRITPHSRTPSQFSVYMLCVLCTFWNKFLCLHINIWVEVILSPGKYFFYLTLPLTKKETGRVGVKEGNIKSTCKTWVYYFFVSSSRKFLYM